ncbi:MAG: hypothetical protein AB8H47_29955 [Bacteroidia bacterium]
MSQAKRHIAAKIWSVGFILLLLGMGLRGLWLAKVDGNNLFHKFRLDRLTITTKAFDDELSQYAGGDTALFYPLGTLNYEVRHRALSRKILIGQGDWFFLWSDQMDIDPLEQRLGLSQLSRLQMQELVLQYQQRAFWSAQRNSQYLLVLAPNKASIYGEYLPSRLSLSEATFLDSLSTALQNAAIPVLDLRPPLNAAKSKGLLYYRHDTHWNHLGSWVGTQAVLQKLEMPPLPHDIDQFDSRLQIGGDQLRMARLSQGDYFDVDYKHKADPIDYQTSAAPLGVANDLPYYSQNDSGPKLLLLHDSFGHYMRDWMSYSSQELLALWAWGEFRPEIANAFKPEIIVDEVIERNLAKVFPGNPAALINEYWDTHWEDRGALSQKGRFSLGQLQAFIQSQSSEEQLTILKLTLQATEAGSLSTANGLRVKANYAFGEGETTIYLQINPRRPFKIELEGKVAFTDLEMMND